MSLITDIDRGLEIVAQMEALEAELKEINARVERVALKGKQVPLEDAERDGTQFLAQGSARLVPVVCTADYLVQSFAAKSKTHEKIAEAAGARLGEFFRPKLTYETLHKGGKLFRRQARQIFEGWAAEKFLAACVVRDKQGLPKSAVKVEWDRARAMAESGVEA